MIPRIPANFPVPLVMYPTCVAFIREAAEFFPEAA